MGLSTHRDGSEYVCKVIHCIGHGYSDRNQSTLQAVARWIQHLGSLDARYCTKHEAPTVHEAREVNGLCLGTAVTAATSGPQATGVSPGGLGGGVGSVRKTLAQYLSLCAPQPASRPSRWPRPAEQIGTSA